MRRSRTLAVTIVLGLALIQPIRPASAVPRERPVSLAAGSRLAELRSGPAPLLPSNMDSDGDGWMDLVEDFLGSDPADATSVPESLAVPESCMNAIDDDGDAAVDEADLGCKPPELERRTFPAAGPDTFESTMTLSGYELTTPLGSCPLDFDGAGPTVVRRSDPVDLGGGLRQINTEIVALQVQGTITLTPGSACNPGTTPVSFPAEIVEDPAKASAGKVSDTNTDPALDFPADSFFDVFFLVSTPLGLLPGGPPGGAPGTSVGVTNAIRSIPPYHTPANPKLNPSCYTVAGLPHEHCPKPPLDHFKCYTGVFPAFDGKATLKDQFGREKVRVRTANRFCNPVSKNGQGIFDDGGHLLRYAISTSKTAPQFDVVHVVVQNQFGVQPMRAVERAGLFVPSRKDKLTSPAALDHFKCYVVKGASIATSVRLEDQFDVADGRVERARVLKPVTLCNPVEKTVDNATTPIGDPTMHLVCYAIETQKIAPRTVLVRNQFGKGRVRVEQPVEMCVPSLKTVVPDIEVDYLPGIVAQVTIVTPTESEVVDLAGTATMEAHLGDLADTDDDGLEQVSTEIVQLDLTGTSTLFGPVEVVIRDPASDPQKRSTGEIEEVENANAGVLDLPPFTPTGTANSFFDVYFELHKTVNGVPIILHNRVPTHLFGLITYKPCWPGDTYESPDVVQLHDVTGAAVPVQIGPIVVGTAVA